MELDNWAPGWGTDGAWRRMGWWSSDGGGRNGDDSSRDGDSDVLSRGCGSVSMT